MLDEINEQSDQMQQIQDAMAQPIGPAADMDEDELLGELEVSLLSCAVPAISLMCGKLPGCCYCSPCASFHKPIQLGPLHI